MMVTEFIMWIHRLIVRLSLEPYKLFEDFQVVNTS
jgi:hypothetical protein